MLSLTCWMSWRYLFIKLSVLIRQLPAALLCCFLTVSSFAGPEQNSLGRTTTGDVGDALEIILPAVTLAATIAQRDYEGAKQFGVGLVATLGSNYLLKEAISKERPDGRDDDSFPSAHTAVSFHAAGYVHERYGLKWALPVYAAAGWVGYSRVYDDRHDEVDVLAGALIGYGFARLFTTTYQGVTVTPEFAEGYVGLQFSIRP